MDVYMTAKTNYFQFWRHTLKDNLKLFKNNESLLEHIISGNVQNLGNRTFRKFWNRWGPGSSEDPFNMFLQILNMRSIYSRKHGMDILEAFGKYGPRTIRRMFSEKLECEINIYRNTWNGHFVIWGQYLPENMKWKLGNMGSTSSNQNITWASTFERSFMFN